MGPRELVAVVGRRWRWIAAAVVVGLLGALLMVTVADRTYRSTASVFFSLQYGDSAADLVQGSTYAQDQVASFAALATTPSVLQPVIDDLDLDTDLTASAVVIEWGEGVAEQLSEARLMVHLDRRPDDSREATLTAVGGDWAARIADLPV